MSSNRNVHPIPAQKEDEATIRHRRDNRLIKDLISLLETAIQNLGFTFPSSKVDKFADVLKKAKKSLETHMEEDPKQRKLKFVPLEKIEKLPNFVFSNVFLPIAESTHVIRDKLLSQIKNSIARLSGTNANTLHHFCQNALLEKQIDSLLEINLSLSKIPATLEKIVALKMELREGKNHFSDEENKRIEFTSHVITYLSGVETSLFNLSNKELASIRNDFLKLQQDDWTSQLSEQIYLLIAPTSSPFPSPDEFKKNRFQPNKVQLANSHQQAKTTFTSTEQEGAFIAVKKTEDQCTTQSTPSDDDKSAGTVIDSAATNPKLEMIRAEVARLLEEARNELAQKIAANALKTSITFSSSPQTLFYCPLTDSELYHKVDDLRKDEDLPSMSQLLDSTSLSNTTSTENELSISEMLNTLPTFKKI